MKKLLVLFLIACSSAFAWEQQAPRPVQACAEFVPYGAPVISNRDATAVCRVGYYTVHDNVAKIPVYGVYVLKPENALGCFPRTNAFTADASLPKDKRATPDDYAGTGYDKGHNIPDGDLSYGEYVELESFLMSNMMPQLPNLNRGIWKNLETNVRIWAWQHGHPLQVIVGPIYQYGDPTIGKNQVLVPRAFYKVVIDTVTGEHYAFLFPHKDGLGADPSVVQTTVAEVEKYAGITINLPAGRVKTEKFPMKPADFGAALNAKKAKCK